MNRYSSSTSPFHTNSNMPFLHFVRHNKCHSSTSSCHTNSNMPFLHFIPHNKSHFSTSSNHTNNKMPFLHFSITRNNFRIPRTPPCCNYAPERLLLAPFFHLHNIPPHLLPPSLSLRRHRLSLQYYCSTCGGCLIPRLQKIIKL